MTTYAEHFHIARSKCIDAFAAVECSITTLLANHGKKTNDRALLRQRIDALREVKPAPSYSKARRTSVHGRLDELESYLCVRSDVVHGRMTVVTVDREERACFINAREIAGDTQVARLISLNQFEKIIAQLNRIAAELKA